MTNWKRHSLSLVISETFAGDWGSDENADQIDVPCVRVADFNRETQRINDVVPTIRSYSEGKIASKHLKAGDILIEKSGGGEKTPVGSAIYFGGPEGFMCTNFIQVLRLKNGHDSRFWTYALRMKYAQGGTNLLINQTTGIQNLDMREYFGQKFDVPDLDAQRRIADYLEKEISEMDAMIKEFERLAENLKTRKVLLTERITAQDDLGNKYPTYPIGLLFQKIGSGTTPKGDEWYTESEEDGIPWVTTSELREIDITETKKYVTKEAVEKVPGLRIHPAGSILIAMYGATIGRFGKLEVPASCNQACCVLSNPYKIDPDFFYASLWAKRDELILFGSGGGQPNIRQDVIKRFEMPVPPLEDQKKIAERLQAENAHMDGLIHDATALAALLKERKTALITEVVTGRKEV